MTVRLTNESFLSRVDTNKIEVLDEYVNSTTKLRCLCRVCGYQWKTKPSHLMDGHGCSNCVGMVKMTPDKFKERMLKVLPKVKIIRPYVGRKTKVMLECEFGHNWEVLPTTALSGKGCHVCNNYRQINNDTYQKYMAKNHPTISVLGVYTDCVSKVNLHCDVCKHYWSTTPSNSMNGHGCPKCSGTKKKTQSEFENDVLHKNPQFEVVGTYINCETPVLTKCKICGSMFEPSPQKLTDRKCLCPWCSKASYGYRKYLPAYLYVYTFSAHVGYGITNNLKVRHSQHTRQFKRFGINANLLQVFEGYGDVVFETEMLLKRTFSKNRSTVPNFLSESTDISEVCSVLRIASKRLKVCENFQGLL